MKLSKIVTAVFSHSDIIDLLADAVSKETDQMVPPAAVTLEVVEGRYVTATVQLTQGASIDEISQQTVTETSVEESEPEAPTADPAPAKETSNDVSAEEALSGPTPNGASDSGVQDPESETESEAPAEESTEKEKPKVAKKPVGGLNFKKTKPPTPEDSEVKSESLFKFAKKK